MLLCNNLVESISMVEPNRVQWNGVGLLILLPVTGRSGGKRKRTVVTITYTMPSCCKIVSKRRMELRNGKDRPSYRTIQEVRAIQKVWEVAFYVRGDS